jgi:hypothetical protein
MRRKWQNDKQHIVRITLLRPIGFRQPVEVGIGVEPVVPDLSNIAVPALAYPGCISMKG